MTQHVKGHPVAYCLLRANLRAGQLPTAADWRPAGVYASLTSALDYARAILDREPGLSWVIFARDQSVGWWLTAQADHLCSIAHQQALSNVVRWMKPAVYWQLEETVARLVLDQLEGVIRRPGGPEPEPAPAPVPARPGATLPGEEHEGVDLSET